MRISRLYLPDFPHQAHEVCSLPATSAHYLCTVLRLKTGDALQVFDGKGQEFSAVLEQAEKRQATLRILEQLSPIPESPLDIHLGLGLTRGERMDYAVQKATELGVRAITPVISERCEVKLKGGRLEKRTAHWQQVAISACEQCGRAIIPTVYEAQTLRSFIEKASAPQRLILDHRQTAGLPDNAETTAIELLTGPEGGFTEDEIEQAVKSGFNAMRLGSRVLRAETAPVAALSILQWHWGDFQV